MKVNEIFTSIDGEVNKWGQGALTTFVRLQGCNLRCTYCDTPKALAVEEGSILNIDIPIMNIVSKIANIGCTKVTITGGEPLAQQPEVFDLIDILMKYEYKISVETNGSYVIPICYLNDERVNWIVDYKWEYNEQMRVNYKALSETDWIKFIVCTETILPIFSKIKEMRKEGVRAKIAVSMLAVLPTDHEWLTRQLIKKKMFDVNLNAQLHKLIGVK